jgi:hypothetical protein
MQVDLSIVFSLVSSVVAAGFGLYVRTMGAREKEHEKRVDELRDNMGKNFAECMRQIRELHDRIDREEKATIRQDGAIELVKQSHSNLADDMSEVKRMLNQILTELRTRGGAARPSGGYSYTAPITSPPGKPTNR